MDDLDFAITTNEARTGNSVLELHFELGATNTPARGPRHLFADFLRGHWIVTFPDPPRLPPPRRVLYYYGAQQMDTGSPKALVGMIGLLDRERYEPCFVSDQDGPLGDALRDLDVDMLSGDVQSLSFRRPVRAWQRLLTQRRRLRDWRIDLVHINAFGLNLDLVLAARLEQIPVVLHLHNPATIHWRNLNRLAANAVLTVSRSQIGTIKGFERIRHKHHVLYNTVDVARWAGGRSIRDSLGLRRDETVVVTVAQLCQRKGTDVVLEVARRLTPVHDRLRFVLVGPPGVGEAKFAEAVEWAAKQPLLRDRVLMLGSRADVPDILASADIFFMPTRAEPFGIAIVEAMAAGLPVVASRIGGIPEIIGSPDLGTLVPPDHIDRFAEAVQQLVADPERARAMGRRAAASVVGRFDRETIGGQLADLYCTLLHS